MSALARVERGYPDLDPYDILRIVLQARLYDHPDQLEAWVDSRILGRPLRQIAAALGVTPQCVSLRARTCEHRIAASLELNPQATSSKPRLEGCAA